MPKRVEQGGQTEGASEREGEEITVVIKGVAEKFRNRAELMQWLERERGEQE